MPGVSRLGGPRTPRPSLPGGGDNEDSKPNRGELYGAPFGGGGLRPPQPACFPSLFSTLVVIATLSTSLEFLSSCSCPLIRSTWPSWSSPPSFLSGNAKASSSSISRWG